MSIFTEYPWELPNKTRKTKGGGYINYYDGYKVKHTPNGDGTYMWQIIWERWNIGAGPVMGNLSEAVD